MKSQRPIGTKFDERRRLNQFSPAEVRAVLGMLAEVGGPENVACVEIGSPIFGSALYKAGADRNMSAELIDAAMHFLERFGFVVDTGKLRWIARKCLTAADVDEACELVPLAYAPMYPRETPFDTLRRVRAGRNQPNV